MGARCCCTDKTNVVEDILSHRLARALPTQQQQDDLQDEYGSNAGKNDGEEDMSAPCSPGFFMDEHCLYRISLDTALPGPLGIQVEHADGAMGLMVVAVTGGKAAAWNQANPFKQVRESDCILEVNGVTGDCAAMLAELQDRPGGIVQVLLIRSPPLKCVRPQFCESLQVEDSITHNCNIHCQQGQPLFCRDTEEDGL